MRSEEINQNPQSESSNNVILNQALTITEIAIELRNRHVAGEKYINYLKTMINGAEKAIAALQVTSRASFNLAKKLVQLNHKSKLPENLKQEFEKLEYVINTEANNLELSTDTDLNLDQLAEKIRNLDSRHRSLSENNIYVNPSSSKSSKIDINEKYPENLSKESLIDLNNVQNLPTVPEDIFTSFSNNNNKPIRTSSLSSLKSMRKVKLFLQKAESSDDEESSDNEEHDYSRLVYGDGEDLKISNKKLQLGNIKEETQD